MVKGIIFDVTGEKGAILKIRKTSTKYDRMYNILSLSTLLRISSEQASNFSKFRKMQEFILRHLSTLPGDGKR